MNIKKLKPCPFCGQVPPLESTTTGTQYELFCHDCGLVCVSIQISDLMTIEERMADKFLNNRYQQKYIDRAEKEVVKRWNTRYKEN